MLNANSLPRFGTHLFIQVFHQLLFVILPKFYHQKFATLIPTQHLIFKSYFYLIDRKIIIGLKIIKFKIWMYTSVVVILNLSVELLSFIYSFNRNETVWWHFIHGRYLLRILDLSLKLWMLWRRVTFYWCLKCVLVTKCYQVCPVGFLKLSPLSSFFFSSLCKVPYHVFISTGSCASIRTPVMLHPKETTDITCIIWLCVKVAYCCSDRSVCLWYCMRSVIL